MIRFCCLDHTISLFRFDNEWYYFFSGENYAYQKAVKEIDPPDKLVKYPLYMFRLNREIRKNINLLQSENIVSQITIISDLEDGTYLFRGLFEGYVFNKTGELDRIHMSEVYRRKIEYDRPPDEQHEKEPRQERYYHIVGQNFVARFENVRNVNIQFYLVK